MATKSSVQRILNCEPSQGTEEDWLFANAEDAGLLAAPAHLPDTVDLRERWWKIGDQGQTGSCVGWATGDSVLRWHFVKADRLKQAGLLSVRYVWMAAKETDEFNSRPTTFIESDGTSLKAALDVVRKFGVITDDVLHFGNGTLYQGDWRTLYALAARLKIASYFNLGSNLDEWRKWLAGNGPILTRLDVDDTWLNAPHTGGKLDQYLPNATHGGHAVAIVGYDKDGFIVRNSWGNNWGDKGFAYASPAYAQSAFTEAYGIVL
jgi:hypothetical protein